MKNLTTLLTLAALSLSTITPAFANNGSSNLEAFTKKYTQVNTGSFEEPAELEITVLALAQPVPARGTEKASSAKETLRRELSRTITCPSFITENSDANVVKALVSVSDEGAVTVYEINTGNARLKQYVQQTLQTVKVDNPGYNEKFVLVINFRVE